MIELMEKAVRDAMVGGTALSALLAGSASIYNLVAPPGSAFDYVIFDVDYEELNDTPKRAVDCTLTVRAITDDSLQQGGSIDAAVEALFRKQELTITGWKSYWQMRNRGFSYVELTPADRQIWHVGGEYSIRLEEVT